MHQVQLCMKHSTSAATPTKNRVVTDEFDKCANPTQDTRQCIDWLLNKRAKNRVDDYESLINRLKRDSVRFYVPRGVTVAGGGKFKSELLRGRYNLRFYFKDDHVGTQCPDIKNDDFILVPELKAVLGDPALSYQGWYKPIVMGPCHSPSFKSWSPPQSLSVTRSGGLPTPLINPFH
jgi:hypothetical protein